MKIPKLISGFTLIELMIALAIIGIISAIAIPSYQNSIRASNRVDGQVALMDATQRLQRCYTVYGSFIDKNCLISTQLKFPGYLSPGGHYKISFAVQPTVSDAYTVRALPESTMQQADKGCLTGGEIKLQHNGVKLPAPPSKCWKN